MNKITVSVLVLIATSAFLSAGEGKDKKSVGVTVDNGVKVALPLVSVNVPIGTVKVGPSGLNVSVGQNNSVTVGPLSVGQSLPYVNIGTDANKNGWIGLNLNGGVNLTLPFLKLGVPFPKVSL